MNNADKFGPGEERTQTLRFGRHSYTVKMKLLSSGFLGLTMVSADHDHPTTIFTSVKVDLKKAHSQNCVMFSDVYITNNILPHDKSLASYNIIKFNHDEYINDEQKAIFKIIVDCP